MRLAVVFLVACSAAHPPPAAQTPRASEPVIAHHTHSCADAALGLENATRGVRAPDNPVFDTLRARCIQDVWPAHAVNCFATMAEGDLGRCSRAMPDAMREAIFAALAGHGGEREGIYVARARLQQLQVGVPECDRFVSAVTTALSCEQLPIEDRLMLGNETAEFWSLPTSRLSPEDKLRISDVCGQSRASLERQAQDVGCML
jgi:hypothetical protein